MTSHGSQAASGALQGLRIVEFAGLGPVSFTAMLLADMGAEVVRIARPGHADMETGATLRGRQRLALDLRSPAGQAEALALVDAADVLLEGFRPGVMERLGLGPETALARNPRLVYGRMTGWGQDGPRAATAGHDIDYIAIAGALGAMGGETPAVPLNLVGDYGGGALYLALGTVAALAHVRAGGGGQVIDCAICDGTVSLLSLVHGLQHAGRWQATRGANVLDGGAPYYRCYRCADGGFVAVGAIEPAFYRILLERLGIDTPLFAQQHERALWPEQARVLAGIFDTRTRDHWAAVFAGTDACVAPVLTPVESRSDAHLLARQAFVALDGELQPAPAPRFGATPSRARPSVDVDAGTVLQAWRGQAAGVAR